MKFAHEGIKSLMLLNGAATISVLTFIGNTNDRDVSLVYAMFCFAIGSLCGPIAYLLAYLTQLNYGKENNGPAWNFHRVTYFCIGVGVCLFIAGVVLAGLSFIEHGQPPKQ